MTEHELLEEIRTHAIVPGCLDMSTWHTCETTHCLAGWAQVIAGDMKKDAEEEGRRLIPSAAFLFFDKDNLVRAWLETRAWLPENRPTFHEAIRKLGVRVVTGDEVYDWTGGDLWSYDNSTVNVNSSQTGGDLRSYGNSTVNVNSSQTGGDLRSYGNSTVNHLEAAPK